MEVSIYRVRHRDLLTLCVLALLCLGWLAAACVQAGAASAVATPAPLLLDAQRQAMTKQIKSDFDTKYLSCK